MSVSTSFTRAGLLATLAAATLLAAGGTASAAGGADWDLFPSGSVELGPPTGSGAGSVDADLGSSTGSFDADLGSGAPRPGTGSGLLPWFLPIPGSAG
ncbi:hypothetical protein ACFC06_13020 [Nocardia sp. NPDC056064]|uniref:hypothetical protein n=1 Tax=Nocardia sp. NPDC056064 TaxID=3345701 RepID=UPI0035D53113